jgi:transposase-like protein
MIGIHDFRADSGIQVFKRGDPERKRKILELFREGDSQSDIARRFGITKQAVAQTITKAEEEEQASQAGEEIPWYQRIADDKLEECNAAAGKENPEWSTKLAEAVTVRDITENELMMHTYPHTPSVIESKVEKTNKIKAGRRWLQERLTDSPPSKNHHGFVIFPAPHYNVSDCAVVNKQLPGLLDGPYYQKVLKSIFQSVQGKDGNTSHGDNKRKQAKLSELAEMAEQRHKEAKGKFDRFLNHTSSVKKTKAFETMREIAAEGALVNKVVDHMLELYSGIANVSLPYQ